MIDLTKEQRKIVVYGTGLSAVKWVFEYEQKGNQIDYFLNTDRRIDSFCGKTVYSPSEEKVKECYIIVVVASVRTYLGISEILQQYSLREFDDYIYYKWLDKKIVLLSGNCHIWIVQKYLESSLRFMEEYAIYPNPAICRNTKGEIEDVVLEHSDVWIHQDIRPENEYGYKLSDEYLRTKIKPQTYEIIFPNLFGMGRTFYPNSSHNNNNIPMNNGQDTGGMFPCTDSVIERCVLQGKDLEEIISYAKSEEAMDKEFVIDNFNVYMSKIKEREQTCDIKIHDFILEHYKDEQLFYDWGHPSNIIIKKFAMDILQKLGIPDKNIYTEVELDAYEMPVYPAIRKHLGLRWEKENIRECKGAKKIREKMNLEEYIFEYLWWCHGYREELN